MTGQMTIEEIQETNSSYQGWSNYETWKLALNLDNDEFIYRETRRMAHLEGENFTGDFLKDWLEEQFEFHEVGYKIADFWSYNEWQEVDFDEVAEAILKEVNEV